MEPRKCECCSTVFPEGEGYLGDICQECNWECDVLEEDGYSSANHSTLEEWRTRQV